jgi:DNA-binding SARP family transcriptional activator
VELIERHRWTNFLALLPREAALVAHRALLSGGGVDVIRDSIQTRRLPAPAEAGPDWPWPLRVSLLGTPRLERFGETIQFQGKVQRKPLELLKYLACARDMAADHTTACEALWPDSEEFAARRSLEMATARLRELLGNPAWVRVAEGRTRLDREYVWSDAQALWSLCAQAGQVARSDASKQRAPEIGAAMLALYRGALLEGDEEVPWLLGTRERLRTAFVRAVRTLTDGPSQQDHGFVVALLEQAFAAEPLAEELAQRLMRAYANYGQPAEAMRIYRQLRQMLSSLLGSEPSHASEELRRTIASQI